MSTCSIVVKTVRPFRFMSLWLFYLLGWRYCDCNKSFGWEYAPVGTVTVAHAPTSNAAAALRSASVRAGTKAERTEVEIFLLSLNWTLRGSWWLTLKGERLLLLDSPFLLFHQYNSSGWATWHFIRACIWYQSIDSFSWRRTSINRVNRQLGTAGNSNAYSLIWAQQMGDLMHGTCT